MKLLCNNLSHKKHYINVTHIYLLFHMWPFLLLKGIRCSANSLWQKYNTKYKNHFDHLTMFSLAGQCMSTAMCAQFGLGEDLQEVVRSFRKEGRKEGRLGVINTDRESHARDKRVECSHKH